MPNEMRGEAVIIVGGEEKPALLTLGAIAQIESDLDMGFQDIGQIMSSGHLAPLSTIAYWMLRAGGWKDLKKEDMIEIELDLKSVMRAFRAATKIFSELDADQDEDELEVDTDSKGN